MTTPRDPDRLIRAFLDEGSTELPDRTYDAVREHIEQTRQRAVLGPWKEPVMPMIARFAAAAAAVVVAAAVGLGLIAGGGQIGRPPALSPTLPPASASPTAAANPTPTAAQVAVPPDYQWPLALGPGTYQTDFGYHMPFDLRFTVGEGWTGYDVSMQKGGTVALRVMLVENVFEDACAPALLDPPVGPTIDDLADALAAMDAIDATSPVDATLGGASGKALEYTLRSAPGCNPVVVDITRPDCEVGESADAACHVGSTDVGQELAPGERNRTWVLDVAGFRRLVVQAISAPSATAADLADLQAVLDSLEFVRTAPITPNQP